MVLSTFYFKHDILMIYIYIFRRVEIKGNASITEVVFKSSLATDSSNASPENANPLVPYSEEQDLRNLIEKAIRKETQLQTKIHRLSKQREVLDSIADSLINANNSLSEKVRRGFQVALFQLASATIMYNKYNMTLLKEFFVTISLYDLSLCPFLYSL